MNSGWKTSAADPQRLVLGHADIGAGQVVDGGVDDLAAGEAAKPAGRGDVVGVDVGVQGAGERQLQLLQHRQVAFDRLDDRIEEHGLPGLRVGEQVGVGRGLRLVELTEDHMWAPMWALGSKGRSRSSRAFSLAIASCCER